jgi:hypothetical protein
MQSANTDIRASCSTHAARKETDASAVFNPGTLVLFETRQSMGGKRIPRHAHRHSTTGSLVAVRSYMTVNISISITVSILGGQDRSVVFDHNHHDDAIGDRRCTDVPTCEY